jgi:hypothetical protein
MATAAESPLVPGWSPLVASSGIHRWPTQSPPPRGVQGVGWSSFDVEGVAPLSGVRSGARERASFSRHDSPEVTTTTA